MGKISLVYDTGDAKLPYYKGNSALKHFEMHLGSTCTPDVMECMFRFMVTIGYAPDRIYETMKDIADGYKASNFMEYFCDERGQSDCFDTLAV